MQDGTMPEWDKSYPDATMEQLRAHAEKAEAEVKRLRGERDELLASGSAAIQFIAQAEAKLERVRGFVFKLRTSRRGSKVEYLYDLLADELAAILGESE